MSVTDIFWVVFGLVLYTYFGYPILLSLLTAGRRQPAYPADQDLPTISLVVTAFNEESVLRGKLENSFALDYPQDRLQVIVVSDGSTDGTDDVARDFAGRPGYLFLRQEQNAGKTTAQNAGVRVATGDILVFLPRFFVDGDDREDRFTADLIQIRIAVA